MNKRKEGHMAEKDLPVETLMSLAEGYTDYKKMISDIEHFFVTEEQRHFLKRNDLTVEKVVLGDIPNSLNVQVRKFLHEPWMEAMDYYSPTKRNGP